MVFQHCKDLKEPIRKIGCEYLACLAAAEHFLVNSISTENVNLIWEDCAVNGVIDTDFALAFPDSYRKLFAYVSQYVDGPDLFGDQVGAIEKGHIQFWSWFRGHRFNYVLRRMFCRDRVRHTILLDTSFQLLYDSAPWLHGREIIGDYLYYLSTPENFRKVAAG
jgi:hypothetical protein